MRWMLLVDTCGAQGSVGAACLEGSPELRAERVLPGRETQERLMTAIAEVLADAGIHLSDLDVLAAISGPSVWRRSKDWRKRSGSLPSHCPGCRCLRRRPDKPARYRRGSMRGAETCS